MSKVNLKGINWSLLILALAKSINITSSGMLTVKKVSFLSSHPSHDVSGSKIYVLFGMYVTMLLSLVQLSTSFDLSSLI